MKKVRQLLLLKFESKLTHRMIGRALNLSPGTVSYYSQAAQQAGLSWPLPSELDNDDALMALLEPMAKQLRKRCQYSEPDWQAVHQSLRRKHVTLMLLWEGYCSQASGAARYYSYAQFTRRYKSYAAEQKLSMRQQHTPGEKAFIDYAGTTLPIYCRQRQCVLFQAQIFLMVLGASDYTFAYASRSQSLPDWIDAHLRAFDFFGGTPAVLVPDNLKSGVTKACQFEPQANPTYADLAEHYQCAIIPARKYKPKDKAKVEQGVGHISRQIMARLAKQRFYSLQALNNAIADLLHGINRHCFQKKAGSRHSHFIDYEQAALRPLPTQPYQFTHIKQLMVPPDYHVLIDGCHYSVPYTLIGKRVQCRMSTNMVEICYKNERVASHAKSTEAQAQQTNQAHMPKAHQQYQSWTPQTMLDWARDMGDGVQQFANEIIKAKQHPEQCARIHLGLKRLGKPYNKQRLNQACMRAMTQGCMSFRSLNTILKHGLDQANIDPTRTTVPNTTHDNLRGQAYYQIHHEENNHAQ